MALSNRGKLAIRGDLALLSLQVAISPDRVVVKAKDWRIFYTLPADGEDPGLATVLTYAGAGVALTER